MNVVLIGSGNAATVIGRELLRHGHRVLQVCSKTRANATALAQELHAVTIDSVAEVDSSADLYILAVSDAALPVVAAELPKIEGLVLHVSGTVSVHILKCTGNRYGVLWPMKMLRKTMQQLGKITLFVDGNSEETVAEVMAIGKQLGSMVARADDETRMKMHLLAALVSNFTNHLYHLAADYCTTENIDFALFYPLIEETARQVQSAHPKELQAGPAFRGDETTLQRHLALLKEDENLQKVYNILTRSIRKQFGS